MSRCSQKKGIWVIKQCENAAFTLCAVCKTPFCTEHLTISADKRYLCLQCMQEVSSIPPYAVEDFYSGEIENYLYFYRPSVRDSEVYKRIIPPYPLKNYTTSLNMTHLAFAKNSYNITMTTILLRIYMIVKNFIFLIFRACPRLLRPTSLRFVRLSRQGRAIRCKSSVASLPAVFPLLSLTHHHLPQLPKLKFLILIIFIQ